MKLRLQNLSIRAKLALILGLTIFALAATRALGLSQLGAFLDRFAGYTSTLEALYQARSALDAAELERLAGRVEHLPPRRVEPRAAQLVVEFGVNQVDLAEIRLARVARHHTGDSSIGEQIAHGRASSEPQMHPDDHGSA